MQAGRLRKRAFFQRKDREPDEQGGGAVSWVPLLDRAAAFAPERGRERLKAGRLEAALGGVVTIRSCSATRAITEADRVLIDGVPYQIRSIANPDSRDRDLEIVVEKGVAT